MAKPTTDDLFETLAQAAETVPQKAKGKKKSKPTIELDEAETNAFNAFCASDVVFKMVEGRRETAKAQILPVLRRKLLEKWIDAGHKTDNPSIQTDKARANFGVRNVLKVEVPENEDGSPGSVRDRLLEAGFDPDEADGICDREFKEHVDLTFRSLNELRTGLPSEQKAVKKLLDLIVKNFSPDEQKILLRKETKVEINENFLDRTVQHTGNNIEKLDALLTVVMPQWVVSHANYSGQDLKQIISDVLPDVQSNAEDEFYTAGWKAVVRGDTAILYEITGNQEILVGEKKCTGGPDHARMTCKKWMRDEVYRETFISEVNAGSNK